MMKYLNWAIAALCLMALWIITMKKDLQDSVLYVAFPSKKPMGFYEPTRIHFADEYTLLESIYSPLVELDNKGAPVSSIAREHYWRGDELHFVIREGLTTIDGYHITVDDVIVSLKRLLILSENTHGDFKSLICPDRELKSIEDDCPGISKEGKHLLVLRPKARMDFLVPMLASIDFAIIPKMSLDPRSLKITDYRNTSGPYYVEKDEGGGNMTLKPNKTHFHFSENMAREIRLVPTKGVKRSKVIDLFNQGKINHITTVESFSIEELKRIDGEKRRVHETIPIKTEVAYITDRGRKRFSLEQRLAFAKSLQKAFHDHFRDQDGYRLITQFFLPFGEGGFSKEEGLKLEKTMNSAKMNQSGKGISLGLVKSKSNGLEEYIKIAKTYMPDLKAGKSNEMPAFTKNQESEFDYIIVATDSGFLENISLLSYTMNGGIFGFSKKKGKDWIRDYMKTPERKERIKKLKKMHLESITQGLMIPLFSTPYLSISRKPWKPQLSEIFAHNPLWKIRKD